MQDIVFQLKKAALDLSLKYAQGNRAKARRVYGMSNPNSFKKLIQNPQKLHPDSRQRSKRPK